MATMPTPRKPAADVMMAANRIIADRGLVKGAASIGVHPSTLSKVADGDPVAPSTIERIMGNTESWRSSKKVRRAEEFRGSATIRKPREQQPSFAWSIANIKAARADQLRGKFKVPSMLAQVMRTNSALFSAYQNRIAPQSAIEARLLSSGGTRGDRVCSKAKSSILTPRPVLAGIHGTMANHGVAIGYVQHEPDEYGTAINMALTEWPLEFVRYDERIKSLVTQTDGGLEEPIVHGDGHWIVFSKFGYLPWRQDAALLAAAIVWAAHTYGITDWTSATKAAGQTAILGELPEHGSIGTEDDLTPEASSLLQTIQDIVSGDARAGIIPSGSKATVLNSAGSAWQVFKELILNQERAAARIYLGTDGTLGAVGGAPGVDIATLFGVATTRIQGDFEALERGLRSGLYEPWTAINEGDSRYAPSLAYQIPDPDAEAKAKGFGDRLQAFLDAIDKMGSQGFIVDQEVVDALAVHYGVPSYALAPTAEKKVALELAPTSLDAVIRGREARASQGLPPFGDERDDLTIEQIKALSKAQGENATNEPAPEAA